MGLVDRQLFDHDPVSGITEYYYHDDETGGFAIETRQDISAIIEVNKAMWNSTDKHTRYRDGIGGMVARTPNVVLMELAKQRIVTPTGTILDHKKYRAWLNDPENLCFRTRAGRV